MARSSAAAGPTTGSAGPSASLTLTAYGHWRHQHAIHHATAGNLDRARGRRRRHPDRGRVPASSHRVAAAALPPDAQPALRARRRARSTSSSCKHRLPSALCDREPGRLAQRPGDQPRDRGLVAVAAALVGWREFLLVQAPITWLASSIGVWLFYVQHQFEDTSWERDEDWTFHDGALAGSSHLDLPPVLRWFTANIGVHHVHHLSAASRATGWARCCATTRAARGQPPDAAPQPPVLPPGAVGRGREAPGELPRGAPPDARAVRAGGPRSHRRCGCGLLSRRPGGASGARPRRTILDELCRDAVLAADMTRRARRQAGPAETAVDRGCSGPPCSRRKFRVAKK